MFSIAACGDGKVSQGNLDHYDLARPQKFELPGVLQEISGIAFTGNSDTIYTEQDEEGKLFHFKPGDKEIETTRFAKKGDYEDVTIYKNTVIMLRSDGMLVTFPLSEANDQSTSNAYEWKTLLPAGEYEALFADEKTSRVYVLCKKCVCDKSGKATSGYIFTINDAGGLSASGRFQINVKEIGAIAGDKKIKFRPSALTRNLITGEWYVLSSINEMIVIADQNWIKKK
ncbi:MAG: SdiA-regulated family protein [Chitinophagaceae bacterium]|nr:SdiA-regulated family protein [Chitinophagaceae bacterium]